jgi:multidrug efflux system outer membrane protein
VQQYFIYRGAQAQLASTGANAERQEQTWRLTQIRLDAGVATPIDVQRAKSQYYATLARVPPLEQLLKGAQHRLAVLTGVGTWQQNSSPLFAGLLAELKAPAEIPPLPEAAQWQVGPGTILRQRPDILAAEFALRQATANIGVAQAQWYPKITFLGDIGLAADAAEDVGGSDSLFSLLGVRLQWAGLGMMRVNNRVKRAKILAETAHAQYKKTVLLAFEEVENALVNYQSRQAVAQHLTQGATAAKRAADLAQARYEGGVIGFIEVLDAEKRQLDIETELAAAKTQEAIAAVAVMRSLALR